MRAAVVVAAAGLGVGAPALAEPVVASAARPVSVLGDAIPQGPGLEERLAAIQRRVQAKLDYPRLAKRRRAEGMALVAFEVGADGHARGVAIARSSGFPPLDRAALRAVREADALPFVYGRLEIPVHFELAQRPTSTP